MTVRVLPQDVVSLIHHVQLNQHGWWRKGVGQVLSGILWKAGRALSVTQIRQTLADQLGVSMLADEVQSCLSEMQIAGTVSEIKAGEFRLSEQSTRELTKQSDEGAIEISQAKAFFSAELARQCGLTIEPNGAWQAFIQELTLAVRQTGANTFNLLTGEKIERREEWLVGFVQHFGAENIVGLKAVVAAFFSAANPLGKQYVLRLLTAYFFVEATQLNRRTIESIDAKRSKRKLRLYLDTNFIFSVLGLHDNPADDAALSLLELAKSARQYIDIKFIVAPHTLDETQRTVFGCLEAAKRVQVSRVLQVAASSAPLPGAVRKFFNAANSAGVALSADDFFGPYVRNLKTVLHRKGIDVDEDIDISKYRLDQRVIDDVLWLNAREQSRTSGHQKSYEAIEHDVILWYAVNDRRPQHTESPFDAESWVVTIDTRLAAFDKSKTPSHSGVPTALFPSSLAQLMQFWVPRSDQLETTLLDSLKLPLFFKEFDREDERVTMRILGAMSRFGDVDDLGVETVRELLVNDALRRRIEVGATGTEDEVFALVQEEIVQRHKALLEKLAEVSKQAGSLSSETMEASEARKLAENRADDEKSARRAAELRVVEERDMRVAAELRAKQDESARHVATVALAEKEAELVRIKLARSKSNFLWRFCFGVPATIVVACVLVGRFWPTAPIESVSQYWPQLGYAAISLIIALGGAWRAIVYVEAHPELGTWWIARRVKGISLLAIPFFGNGVLPGFVGDFIKKMLGIS